jgi:hypothetical protein
LIDASKNHQNHPQNEPQQYILLNSWIVERWKDELLYWDTGEFEVGGHFIHDDLKMMPIKIIFRASARLCCLESPSGQVY